MCLTCGGLVAEPTRNPQQHRISGAWTGPIRYVVIAGKHCIHMRVE